MMDRFNSTDYAEVVAELQRKDCHGHHYIDKIPSESEVEKVLSDTRTVRYVLYTTDKIYVVYIEEHANMYTDDDVFAEWEMYVLDR
jgi:hypothetical protein